MVIGSNFLPRSVLLSFLFALAITVSALRSSADDQITKTDGTVISGQITGASGGQVTVESRTSSGGIAKIPYYISDIKSVSMATPADVAKASLPGTAPAMVVTVLEPRVKQFAGLPADWVVQAMAQLAQAYAAQNQADKATAMFGQIDKLYPGSKYHVAAAAGMAEMSLKAGKIQEALAAVQPIINQANKDIAPSPSDGALYANAFLVYGQALEAEKKPQQALEAYLTVTTMFYQNPALAQQADLLAKNLRDHNPGIGID
jgi:tetratricopeptide (TPR) repeat protein